MGDSKFKGVDVVPQGIVVDHEDGTTVLYSNELLEEIRGRAIELPRENESGVAPLRPTYSRHSYN